MTTRIPWGPDSPGYPNCPVPAGHDCTVYFRDGDFERSSTPELWGWRHEGRRTDIIAYCDHDAPNQANGDLTPAQLAYAAEVAERFILADFDGNDIAGLRNGIAADSAIEDFARIVNGRPSSFVRAPDQARELLARGLDVLERFHDHEAANSNTEGALEIEALMADYAAYLKGAA